MMIDPIRPPLRIAEQPVSILGMLFDILGSQHKGHAVAGITILSYAHAPAFPRYLIN
jgi:hypothetical protein